MKKVLKYRKFLGFSIIFLAIFIISYALYLPRLDNHSIIQTLKSQGNFPLIEFFYNQKLFLLLTKNSYESKEYKKTALALANFYTEQGQFNKAIKIYKDYLYYLNNNKNTSKHSLANVYSALGKIYLYQNIYDEAKKYINDAIAIREKILKDSFAANSKVKIEQKWLAQDLNNLGVLKLEKGQYIEAEKLLNNYISIITEYNGLLGGKVNCGIGNLNLVILYEKQGFYKKAEDYGEKSLSCLENFFKGYLASDLIPIINNLIFVKLKLKKYDEVLILLEKLERIYNQTKIKNSPLFMCSNYHISKFIETLENQNINTKEVKDFFIKNNKNRFNEQSIKIDVFCKRTREGIY